MPVPTVVLSGEALTGVEPGDERRLVAAALPRSVKLGRRRPKAVPQALRLACYFDPARATTPPPDVVDYAKKAQASISRMYLNDEYGDCVIAGKYHAVGAWTGNDSGTAVVGTDSEVYQSYESICGPGDNGCVITDVLDVMKAKGLPLAGVAHRIDGYVAIDWTNKLEVQVALYLFGALTLGINLPSAWTSNAVWDVTNTRIVGGHDVTAVGYDATGVQIASWGRVYTITWAAFLSQNWLEEVYALLSPDWYGSDKLAPSGVDAATLAADLAKLGGGVIPDVGPPNPPPPPVVPPSPPPPPGPSPFSWWAWLMELINHLFARNPQKALAMKAIPWDLILLIVKDATVVVPIVVADLQAGKSWQQILADVYVALSTAAQKRLTP